MIRDHLSDTTFRNPFEESNARVMERDDVLNYYCDPHRLLDRESANLFREKNLFLEGGRGCGKTMLLRYLSYEIQRLDADRNKRPLLEQLDLNGAIAFYIRFDNSLLKSFNDLDVKEAVRNRLFIHYFELIVCNWYLTFLTHMRESGELADETSWANMLNILCDLLGITSKTWEDIPMHVKSELKRVNSFRRGIAFERLSFKPTRHFDIGDLSMTIPGFISQHFKELKRKQLLIAIDEYENFSENQQRFVNSMIRSTGENVGFRLGMRSEGIKTFATVQPEEFIKENSDYRVVRFRDILVGQKQYRSFLVEMARKRLEGVPLFREAGMTSIKTILGEEDDVKEASDIVSSRPTRSHFNLLSRHVPEGYTFDEVVTLLRHPENPLLEMLNIVYVLRGHDPAAINQAMREYLSLKPLPREGGPSSLLTKEKYRMDYTDKYKLTLLFLLADYYKVEKKYYGFNIFSFISSGIVRNFVNLCKTSFLKASFEVGDDVVLDEKRIRPSYQHEAAKEEALIELNNVLKMTDHPNEVYNFAKNLGNVFAEYHRDVRMRYPETNTFYVKGLGSKNKEILRTAIRWSIVQPKLRLQRPAPGEALKNIYALNRLLCPLYNISYRTRGGASVESIDDAMFGELCSEKGARPSLFKKERTVIPEVSGQATLDVHLKR